MATVFGNITGLTITGMGGISGSGTVPSNMIYVIFSYGGPVLVPGGGSSRVVVDVSSYGQGLPYTVQGTGTGFYLELTYIPSINAL